MIKFAIAIAMLSLGGVAVYQQVFNSVRTVTLSDKSYEWTESPISKSANDYFWNQFHKGDYDSIPVIIDKLTAAYLYNPNDIRTVTHLGFAHMWALSERQNSEGGPRIIEHAIAAQKYFGESYLMNPADTRVLSFLSSAKLANGSISNDKGLMKDGYLNGKKAIREWEEFSAFTMAYTLSRLSADDAKFKEGVAYMHTLAERHIKNFDPNNAETQQRISSMELLTTSSASKDRVFYNSWIAPHNIEGFFMAYGDMLVKSGDWKEGISVYKLARLSQQYHRWDYQDVLERRITHAKQNVKRFSAIAKPGEMITVDDAIMVQSGISCRSCHQMSTVDRAKTFAGYDETKLLDKKFYLLE